MRNRKKLLNILVIIFTVSSLLTSFNIEANQQVNSHSSKWTLLFYMDGDNKLSGVMRAELALIQNAPSSSDITILVLIDQNLDDDTKLYHIADNTLNELQWGTESFMDDAKTLETFIEKGFSEFPALNYALIMESNKGSAWQGVCFDEHGDGIMITMPELRGVLMNVTNDGLQKLDVFVLYTCLGGSIEVAYEISDYCRFFIGTAECGLIDPNQGWGFPYESTITQLVSNPDYTSEEFSKCCVEQFIPVDYPPYKIKSNMLAADLIEISTLVSALSNLSTFFMNNVDTYNEDIQSALSRTKIFGELWDINYLIEPTIFIEELNIQNAEFLSIKNEITDAVASTIIAKNIVENDRVNCFNLYFPRVPQDYNLALRYDSGILPSSYEETLFACESSWDEFLRDFLGLANNNPPDIPTISGSSKGSPGTEYEYRISSTDPDNNNIFYFVEWGDGTDSGWFGPYSSGEEIIVSHTWNEGGTYIVRAKAKDYMESEWGTLEVYMPKSKLELCSSNNSCSFLIGKISDIETNQNSDFRFLPVQMLRFSFDSTNTFSIDLYDETTGAFPCCGYIDPNEFHGIITSRYICGFWIF